ncbi:MAG: alpha/beta hydrolase [Gammaproteobacteria bacterium]|nr:alpha/beta hydrolase [Gammaproteobacteria bacterium]
MTPANLTAAVALLLSCAASWAKESPVSSFVACEITAANATVALAAECTTVSLPENPDTPNGRRIELKVARLPALGNQPAADPLTFLAGGPGQAASEAFVTAQSAFTKIRQHRDIYLVDQRGTGGSNALHCEKSAEQNDATDFDPEAIEKSSRDCLDALPTDPRWYTTSVAVQDLELVRRTLGLKLWNIYGVSYGTRVALHYLRRHPEHVRAVILDAVVPPTVSLGANLALDAERAFSLMLDRCRTDTDCQQRFPELGERTRELLAELREQPRKITFENLKSGQLESINFTADHLALTLRMMSYISHGTALLPTMLHDAYANDNLAPLARQASLQSSQLNTSIAHGMHHAVTCTEDIPYIELTPALERAIEATYLGLDSIRALQTSCAPWPTGVLDEDFKEPVQSDRPVLILSGEADPITPPAFGEVVAATLPNSLHIVNPGQAHVQAWLGCTPSIMARFIDRANVDDIDFGCLERLEAPPFFIDSNGPTP